MSQSNLAQADFSYADPANDAAGLPLALSIFADRAHLRGQLRDDAQAAGFRIAELGAVAGLLEGDARPLGEVVVLDCPQVSGAELAALSRLDIRAAHSGTELVVSTCIKSLDEVFTCFVKSNSQILVNPSRADRLVALGRTLVGKPGRGVADMGEADRLVLLRLTEQVGQIANQLGRLNALSVESQKLDDSVSRPPPADLSSKIGSHQLMRPVRPPLPDPRLVRRIIRQRQMRARFFDSELFGDPAWDMLLDLSASRAEHNRVSVSSLCIASGVPPTTALRWINQLIDSGLFQRVEDETDRRRAFIALTDKASDAMARYFAELGSSAARMV